MDLPSVIEPNFGVDYLEEEKDENFTTLKKKSKLTVGDSA